MATRIERDHVHAVYSQIAQHFSDTRFKPWPKIAEFLCSLPKGSLVADIGMVRRIEIVINMLTYFIVPVCKLYVFTCLCTCAGVHLLGCGNGKYFGVNPTVYMLGSDICPELISLASSRGNEVVVSDCLCLPYRSSVFDAAICIAVIHHLSTHERRCQALQELMRVVRPGGSVLVYVWAMEQTRKKVCRERIFFTQNRAKNYCDLIKYIYLVIA